MTSHTFCRRPFRVYGALLFAIISLATITLAQIPIVTVAQEELALFAGEWFGTISYQDEQTHDVVSVPGHWSIRDAGDGLSVTVTYTRTDGTPVVESDMIRPSHGGRRVHMNGKAWMLDGKVRKDDLFGLSFQGPGLKEQYSTQFLYQLSLSTPKNQPTDSLMFTKRTLSENDGVPKTVLAYRLGRVE